MSASHSIGIFLQRKRDVDLTDSCFRLGLCLKHSEGVCSSWTAVIRRHCLAPGDLIEFHEQKHTNGQKITHVAVTLRFQIKHCFEILAFSLKVFKCFFLVWQRYQNMTLHLILKSGQSWPPHSSTDPELNSTKAELSFGNILKSFLYCIQLWLVKFRLFDVWCLSPVKHTKVNVLRFAAVSVNQNKMFGCLLNICPYWPPRKVQ